MTNKTLVPIADDDPHSQERLRSGLTHDSYLRQLAPSSNRTVTTSPPRHLPTIANGDMVHESAVMRNLAELARTGGDKSRAAEILNIDLSTLY